MEGNRHNESSDLIENTTERNYHNFYPTIFPGYHIVLLSLVLFNGVAIYLNFAAFLMFTKNGLTRVTSNLLVFTLVITDLLNCALSLPVFTLALFIRSFPFGESGCKWFAFTFTLCGSASVNLMTAIAVDRFIVVLPNTHGPTKRRIRMSLVIAWTVSAFWAISPLVGWSSYQLIPASLACTIQLKPITTNSIAFYICFTVLGLVVPLFIQAVCYCQVGKRVDKVARKARYSRSMSLVKLADRVNARISVATVTNESTISSMTRQLTRRVSKLTIRSNFSVEGGEQTPEQLQSELLQDRRRQRKLTGSMIYLVSIATVTWLPFIILVPLCSLFDTVSPLWITRSAILASTCTVYDPVIYVALNRKYRRAFLKALFCRFQIRQISGTSPPINPCHPQKEERGGQVRDPGYKTPEGRPLPRYPISNSGGAGERDGSNMALPGSRCTDSSCSRGDLSPGLPRQPSAPQTSGRQVTSDRVITQNKYSAASHGFAHTPPRSVFEAGVIRGAEQCGQKQYNYRTQSVSLPVPDI